jgi:hypothetical protein
MKALWNQQRKYMHKVVEWSTNLDLTEFYKNALKWNFVNNTSQRVMIDCFNNERLKNFWVLYKHDTPIGFVGAHSFDDVMGPGSYRIMTRCCVIPEFNENQGLRTVKSFVNEHQHYSDQFFYEPCINWTGVDNVYATSNPSKDATQRIVNDIYFPTLEKIGLVSRIKNVFYRGLEQTVWKIHTKEMLADINRYPRWQ